MKIVAMIPARLHSARLKQKLLLRVKGSSIVQITYRNALATALFDEVYAICDCEELAEEIRAIGGNVLISNKIHDTGTDRVAEFATQLDADVIVNVQADEPQVNKATLQKLIEKLLHDSEAQIATPMYEIRATEAQNPNFVKVYANAKGHAITFSRSAVPYARSHTNETLYWKHVGIYAFRKQALLKFATLQPPAIELTEQLENLRFIYYGMPVALVPIDEQPLGIDTQEDFDRFVELQ
jgi:3-deoxy-manno-octulosonate cytidylyltransferase (CMP-KDO synthetase)